MTTEVDNKMQEFGKQIETMQDDDQEVVHKSRSLSSQKKRRCLVNDSLSPVKLII